MSARRSGAMLVTAVVFTVLIAGCSGGSTPRPEPTGSISLPSPSFSRTTAPAPTQSESEESSEAPDETSTPILPPTSAPTLPPTPESTPTPTSPSTPESEPTTSTAAPEPTSSTSSTPTTSSNDSGTPWWPWVLLGAVLLAGVIWLLVRASRRRAWDTRYAAALDDARWVTTVLTVSLLNPTLSSDAATLYWTESQPRLQALQDELAALGTTKPDVARGMKADRVSSSLSAVVESMSALVALRGAVADSPDADQTLQQSHAALQERSATLQDAIDERPAPTPPPQPPDDRRAAQ